MTGDLLSKLNHVSLLIAEAQRTEELPRRVRLGLVTASEGVHEALEAYEEIAVSEYHDDERHARTA